MNFTDPSTARRLASVVPWVLMVGLFIWAANEARVSQAAREKDRLRAELYIWTSPFPLVVCGEDQKIKLVNPAVEQMFGWSKGELIGNSVNMLLPSVDQGSHAKAMLDAAAKIRLNPGDWQLRAQLNGKGKHRDGHEIPLQLAIRTIKVKGDVEFMAGMRPLTPPSPVPKIEVKPLPLGPVEDQIRESQERTKGEIKNLPPKPNAAK